MTMNLRDFLALTAAVTLPPALRPGVGLALRPVPVRVAQNMPLRHLGARSGKTVDRTRQTCGLSKT